MVRSVAAHTYPATAVVPCAECSFSNLIGSHFGLLANVPEMESAAPNPCASLTIINHMWPCPVLTSAACVKGNETAHI